MEITANEIECSNLGLLDFTESTSTHMLFAAIAANSIYTQFTGQNRFIVPNTIAVRAVTRNRILNAPRRAYSLHAMVIITVNIRIRTMAWPAGVIPHDTDEYFIARTK